MSKKPRLMFIVWWWKDVENQHIRTPDDQLMDWLPVEEYPNDRLYRFDPGKGNAEASMKEIFKFIRENAPDYNILLCLHLNHGYTPEILEEIRREFDGKYEYLKVVTFGKGDHIYLEPPYSAFGLITANGHMFGTFKSQRINATIELNGQHFVKKQHFNSVWHYYQHGIKKEVAESMENLIRTYWLQPMNSVPGETEVAKLRTSMEQLSLKLDEIVRTSGFTFPLDHAKSYRLQINYYPEDVKDLVKSLRNGIKTFWEQQSGDGFAHADSIALRDAFYQLINALPEKTYG